MKIDNKNMASQVRLMYAVVPAVVVLSLVAIYLLDLASNLLPAVLGGCVLAVYVAFALLMQYNYIMIFVAPDKVTVKYKALWPIRTPNNYIEIKAEDFAGYEINKSFLRTNLTIYKNTVGGKAKYPQICINLISKEDIERLKRSFALLETIQKRDS